MNIAIQGGRGSFHDIAARYHFGEGIQITECSGFRILCEELKHNDSVDYAVMAIENSIAASILTNYALIQEYQLQIIGEVYLGIKQYIMVHPESTKSDVKYVMSHYMALNQCEEYLLQHPDWVRKEYHDTADSAKYILENNIKDTAAIASKYAAEIYGLKLLEKESIETYKENFTRFFILTTDKKKRIKEANKATISFRLADKVGALAEVLKIIVDNGVNLSKIQSLPVFGQVNAYRFYVDCEWKEYETFKKSIAINSLVEDLTVLGEYIKGDFVHDYSSSR